MKSQTENEQDKVKEKLGDFSTMITDLLNGFESDLKKAEAEYELLVLYFVDDPKKLASDKFYEKILKFKT